MEDHIQKAREAGLRSLERLRASGVIPQAKASDAPKTKWADASVEQKLEYLLRAVKDSQWPPNQFAQESSLDAIARERKIEQMEEQLHKRTKEFETYKEETDERIKKIMAHSNAMAEQMKALKKMIEQQG
jgi:hypothetical protein